MVEAYPVGHRPVGPSQPFRAGDSPTPKGGEAVLRNRGRGGCSGSEQHALYDLSDRCELHVPQCVYVISVLCDAHRAALAARASAAKLSLHRRLPASVCRYGRNALFSLKETKSSSNAEQPQSSSSSLKQPSHHPLQTP